MKKLFIFFLLLSILGIFILLLISLTIQPKSIKNYQQLKEKDYVSVSGRIISSNYYKNSDFSILRLENNITITCNCKIPANETLTAKGVVENYKGNLQINAEEIERK